MVSIAGTRIGIQWTEWGSGWWWWINLFRTFIDCFFTILFEWHHGSGPREREDNVLPLKNNIIDTKTSCWWWVGTSCSYTSNVVSKSVWSKWMNANGNVHFTLPHWHEANLSWLSSIYIPQCRCIRII